jgi:hypothetical protein
VADIAWTLAIIAGLTLALLWFGNQVGLSTLRRRRLPDSRPSSPARAMWVAETDANGVPYGGSVASPKPVDVEVDELVAELGHSHAGRHPNQSRHHGPHHPDHESHHQEEQVS